MHIEAQGVGIAACAGKGVDRLSDRDGAEAGLFEHRLPARTRQPAGDSTGPQINVAASRRPAPDARWRCRRTAANRRAARVADTCERLDRPIGQGVDNHLVVADSPPAMLFHSSMEHEKMAACQPPICTTPWPGSGRR